METYNRLKRFKRNTFEDARASRALNRREEQKAHREKNQFKNRFITPPVQSLPGPSRSRISGSTLKIAPSTSKKISKREREQLAKQRYVEMLTWKEKKRKQLEAEKKKRRDPFRGGLYEPDHPKFLVGIDSPSNVDSSICLCRSASKSTKKFQTPAAQINQGSKLLANKILDFKSRPTPRALSNRKALPGTSSRLIFRRKDLGVTPLPVTPMEASSTKVKKLRQKFKSSFAPASFSFQAPANVQSFVFKAKDDTSTIELASESDQNLDLQNPEQSKIISSSSYLFKDCSSNPINVSTRSHSISNAIEEGRESLARTNSSFENDPLLINNLTGNIEQKLVPSIYSSSSLAAQHPVPVPASDAFLLDDQKESQFPDDNFCPVKECFSPDLHNRVSDGNSPDLKLSLKLSPLSSEPKDKDVEVDITSKSSSKPRKSLVKRKHSTRCDTPFRTKLRPRTPCSRTTRRSHSAHCDRLSLGSIGSIITPSHNSMKKRRSRLSKTPAFRNRLDDPSGSPTFKQEGMKDLSKLLKGSAFIEEREPNETTNSLSRTLKVNFVEQKAEILPAITTLITAKKEPFDVFKTPLGILSSKKKVPLAVNLTTPKLEESPLANKEHSSSRRKRRPMSSIEKMFNSIPYEGSPIPLLLDDPGECSEQEGISEYDKENIPLSIVPEGSSISPYLKPSSQDEDCVPSPDVWGDEREEHLETTNDTLGPLPSPAEDSEHLSHKRERKSTPFSVNFVAGEKDDARPSIKYRSTPVRRSTRITARVSLLPGLSPTLHPAKESDEGMTQDFSQVDLISWITPTLPQELEPKRCSSKSATKGKRKSKRPSVSFSTAKEDNNASIKYPLTPVRRSTRLASSRFSSAFEE